MHATEFKPGDHVRVKSGRPIMQVSGTAMLEEDAVGRKETFVPVVLEKAKRASALFSVGVLRA
jgi:hypothetical protein